MLHAGIAYRHEIELGGRRSGEPGEERFACIGGAAFRSYAARMARPDWQEALDRSLAEPEPCFMCAETLWWRCHRRLIADFATLVRAADVQHLMHDGRLTEHRLTDGVRREGDALVYDVGETGSLLA